MRENYLIRSADRTDNTQRLIQSYFTVLILEQFCSLKVADV